jgi:ABC transport system ATP-binding/permease protein
MSLLIHCQNISKSFGLVPVFTDISLSVNERERIGIVGPNGAGKSTLLKILAGLDYPDKGILAPRRQLRVGYVPQEKSYGGAESVRSILDAAVEQCANLTLDSGKTEALIGQAGFIDADIPAASLSGGWKKRLSILEVLVTDPDIVLLDEPTNHLDLEGIEWLEEVIMDSSKSFVTISHDRYFLETIATRMVEVNRIFPNGVFSCTGTYSTFMEQKALFLEGQEATLARAANKLRLETAWLRRGAPARTTKQQARIKTAGQLSDLVNSLSERTRRQNIGFQFSATQRDSKRLIAAENIFKKFGDKKLFENLNFTLTPNLRLGLLGPNGSGKSTLIKVLLKEQGPDQGQVFHAENLKIVYYDQYRADLPSTATLKRALAPDSDSVVFQGRSLHVVSYAKKFGFRSEQLETDVGRLSGGEKARVQLARMLLQPADVLILDEPTNDLDIDTLEILEETILEFPGAVILVTHDRYLMDRVSNGNLALLGDGRCEFFADYSQYAIHLKADLKRHTELAQNQKKQLANRATSTPQKPKKLTYKDQRDLETIEVRILEAEKKLQACQETVNNPEIQSRAMELQKACDEVTKAQSTVDALYHRWQELESLLT